MNNRFAKLICLFSATMLLLCGCSWSSDDVPQVPETQKAELVLAAPLTSSGNLTASDGSVIAQYSASYPQFEENSIERIHIILFL